MSLFPLLLLLAHVHAYAQAPEGCENLYQFDQTVLKSQIRSVRSDYAEACKKAYEQIVAAHLEMKRAVGGVEFQANSPAGATQAEMLEDAATIANAGALSKEARAQILDTAARKQGRVRDGAETARKQFLQDADQFGKRVVQDPAIQQRYREIVTNGNDEWAKVRNIASNYANASLQAKQTQLVAATELYDTERRARESGERLGGGRDAETKSGISKNTLVALGGAAVIGAGVVGGMYWVTKKSIQRAEDSAMRVIREAEASATRMVEMAEGSVNRVIRDMEGSVDRIYARIQTNLDSMIADLSGDMDLAFSKLSTPGLEKLNTEMGQVFDALEQRATSENKPELVEKIRTARERIMGRIQQEMARRTAGTSSSTSTSTSSSTATESESSTETGTSTDTSTSTTVSTNPDEVVNRVSPTSTRTTIQVRQPADSR